MKSRNEQLADLHSVLPPPGASEHLIASRVDVNSVTADVRTEDLPHAVLAAIVPQLKRVVPSTRREHVRARLVPVVATGEHSHAVAVHHVVAFTVDAHR